MENSNINEKNEELKNVKKVIKKTEYITEK